MEINTIQLLFGVYVAAILVLICIYLALSIVIWTEREIPDKGPALLLAWVIGGIAALSTFGLFILKLIESPLTK